MGFNQDYLQRFYSSADALITKEKRKNSHIIKLGAGISGHIPPEDVIKITALWVKQIETLLDLIKQRTPKGNFSPQFIQLFQQRGITYEEYYYLFSKEIQEESFFVTPAYIFTKTFSKEQRERKFGNMKYSPQSYRDFILRHDLIPTQFFLRSTDAKVPFEKLFQHSYCVAKTRSGKTEFMKLLIANMALKKDEMTSLLIMDPHGEFSKELRRLKVINNNIDRLVYIDPTLQSQFTPVFNPFEVNGKNIENLAYITDSILHAFEQLLVDQSLTGNMKRLMRHCVFALLYHEDTTMLDLLTMLTGISRNRNRKVSEFLPKEEALMNLGLTVPDPLTRNFFEYGWKDVDSRTITAVIERVDGILSHPLVRRFVVGKSSFDLSNLLNSGKIIIVNLDFTKLGDIGSEAIGRLLISEAQNTSARRSRIPKNERPRTMIFLDEAQRFLSADIERALSEFGKFNSSLFLAHQYIEQIEDSMMKGIISNTANKFIGRNSAATMSTVSADIGISTEDLLKVKQYQFYAKIGDTEPFLFQSSDELIDRPNSPYYLTEDQSKSNVDKIMLQNYYRRVEDSWNRSGSNLEPSNTTKREIEEPTSEGISLNQEDF